MLVASLDEEAVGRPYLAPRARNVRLVIRYQGSATIRQGKTVIEGACVVESDDDQLAEPVCRGLDASTIRHPGRTSRKDARGYASTRSPSVRVPSRSRGPAPAPAPA